jgi:hypothetical protein
MSARRALVLIDHLPPGGPFLASIRAAAPATTPTRVEADPSSPALWRGWDVDRYLLADLVDAVRAVQWTVAAVNSRRKPRRPSPTPRPDQVRRSAGVPPWQMEGE